MFRYLILRNMMFPYLIIIHQSMVLFFIISSLMVLKHFLKIDGLVLHHQLLDGFEAFFKEKKIGRSVRYSEHFLNTHITKRSRETMYASTGKQSLLPEGT